METINYGISRKYLSHWGINEALREIMQNFMDAGEYKVSYGKDDICISNSFVPKNLEFLALGNSAKEAGSRGKYGEGLKMALLIFAREGYDIIIQTTEKNIRPVFIDTSIGETLALEVDNGKVDEGETPNNFCIYFRMPYDIWKEYYDSVIKPEDVIFDDGYYGRIVEREAGNLYCGGLFVKHIKNLSKAYDLNVAHLPLTRDRNLPVALDVNWACSKINSKYGQLKVTDLTYSDTEYVDDLPKEVKKQIEPKLVGNSIEATYKHEGQDVVIKNDHVKAIVLKDSFFKSTVKKLRNYLLDKIGVYEMLVQFRNKHIHNSQARDEFNVILEKLKP